MTRRLTFALCLGASAALGATRTVQVGPGTVFTPQFLVAFPGDTVVWHFNESNHTTTSDATSGAEAWDSGVMASGATFSHTFTQYGSFPYYCAVHSVAGGTMMNGSVQVVTIPPLQPPSLASVTPDVGDTGGGTAVTIAGQGLTGPCTADFGGAAATQVVTLSTVAITAVTPAHAPGTVNLRVVCASGTANLPDAFTFLTPVSATAAVPATSLFMACVAVVALAALGCALAAR